jgi:hypothetical protein
MAKTHIELLRASKPKRGGTHYANITIDERQPIPAVGDDVVVTKGDRTSVVRVTRRLFHYLDESLYLQLYFTKVD